MIEKNESIHEQEREQGMSPRTGTSPLKILSMILSFQIGFGIPLMTYLPAAQASEAAPTQEDVRALRQGVQAKLMREWANGMKSGFGGRDPALRDLMSTDVNALKASIPDFSSAPVDQDPFFLRSQSWAKSNSPVLATQYGITSDEHTTEIQIPGAARKLVLNVPMRGVLATDEYLFFNLHPKSDLMDRTTGVAGSEGGGLFVIETALLATHARRGTPVPVFFLPIMGQGWNSELTALQVVEGDILAVSNKTEVIPFLMKDIREIIQIAKINLDMSVLIALTKVGGDGKVAITKLMPAPGSTALFGLVVTGLDTSRPGYNFFRDFKSLAQVDSKNASGIAKSEKSRFQELLSKLGARSSVFKLGAGLLGAKPAEAQEASDPVTDALWRSAFFGSIVATTIVIAFALKYKSKAIRQRLDAIQKYREALDPETVKSEKMRGFREFMRIEGSILASIAQFPLITPSIAAQYFVDRAMPSLGAGDHTLMRKVLSQTVYPNLRHFGKIAVNEKVTILGTGYAATVGIGIGALHYFYLLPGFVQAISPSLPDGLSLALNETFSTANRQTQATLFTNLLVGASIGILRGPADFTMDAKSQVVEELYQRVDNNLRREGLNPDDPKIQSRREAMREALIDLSLVQKGLPTSKEVLFDTMSLYTSTAAARGYSAPSNDTLLANINPLAPKDQIPYATNEKGETVRGADGKPVVQEGNFVLTSRRGLLPNVLNRALAQAKAWQQVSPSADTANAVRLIERMISDSERLRTILPKVARQILLYTENPALLISKEGKNSAEIAALKQEIRDISARALAFRQLIVMSNYEGAVEYTARYLPVTWAKEYGSGATNMAVLYLRQGLASYLDGGALDNIVARRADLYSSGEQGREKAIEQMKAERADLARKSNADIMADANLRAEVLQRANILAKAQGDETRANENADRYKPKFDWIENWRHGRALRRAEARLGEYALQNSGNVELLSKANLEARLQDYYVAESGKQVGLRIPGLLPENQRGSDRAPWQSSNEKFDTMIAEIKTNSEILAKRQLETRNVKAYLDKLDVREATSLKLQLHAAVFLAAYRDATTMTDALSPLDSAQPGMTQGLRQALTRQTAKDLATLEKLESERSNSLDKKLLRLRSRVVTISTSAANRTLRVVDSMFNDLSVDRGALGAIQRRVPFAEEFVSANIRNMKLWPVAFTVSWGWSHFALGTGIDYSFWVTSILTQGIFVMAPVQWIFRNFRMQAFKPYDSDRPAWKGVRHLASKYALAEMLAYTVTFIAIMPAVLLTSEVGRNLTTYVGTPIVESMQRFSFVEISGALLTGALTYMAGGSLYEKWRLRSTTSRLSILNESPDRSTGPARASPLTPSKIVPSRAGGKCEALFLPAGA